VLRCANRRHYQAAGASPPSLPVIASSQLRHLNRFSHTLSVGGIAPEYLFAIDSFSIRRGPVRLLLNLPVCRSTTGPRLRPIDIRKLHSPI